MIKKIIKLYKKWIIVGKKIATIQTKIIFTLFYFILIIPIGFLLKPFLKYKKGWIKIDKTDITIDEARRQF
ncbi:MAG: hypothetical protein H0Z29_05980 [Candidatus Marinimicrobia bacterium]|nr:hypothetical protein [Candidatus Neomarinimicrobiota bacterium]